MEDTSVGMEKVCEDQEVCSEDRRYIVELINMSLQQLWDRAYQQGFEDAQAIWKTETRKEYSDV
jgi:hypothetical protein